MSRVLTNSISSHASKHIVVRGWLHKKRKLGGLNFLLIRDRAGVAQILVEDEIEMEKLRGLQIGTVIEVKGLVHKDERAPGGAELHKPEINVIVPVEAEPPIEIDKPLDHKSENLDTLFEYRPYGLRNIQETAIFKIQHGITRAIRNYFESNDFIEVHTPKLLATATEGGAEVFKLDYFGQQATLAQSPQFYKQMLVGVFERVYEIAPVYRAEPSATTRHMTEYTSIDAEMGFIDIEDLKQVLSDLLNGVVDYLWKNNEIDLKSVRADKPKLLATIPSLTLEEIHELYSEATGQKTIGEEDLRPDEERWICEYAEKELGCEAVFVTDWPSSGMKFYHKAQEKNDKYADRIDLLFRGLEIVTGSMREHDHKVVLDQLKKMTGGDPEDPGFKYFLMAMQAGIPPHGGFGMGLERLTEKIIGLKNVKEATLFPRDINRLSP